MNFIDRKSKAFNCFMDFKKDCNVKEYQQFVDIFSPMLFKENNHLLEISVGKKTSDSQFMSWLSLAVHNFIVLPAVYNNEPQLIIRNNTTIRKENIALINLTAINNLSIKTEESSTFYRHNICFNYNNKVDYQMDIVVDKE